jgi:hypothetical protein
MDESTYIFSTLTRDVCSLHTYIAGSLPGITGVACAADDTGAFLTTVSFASSLSAVQYASLSSMLVVSLPPVLRVVPSGLQVVQTCNSQWTTLWGMGAPPPGSAGASQNLAQLDLTVSILPSVTSMSSGGSVRLVDVTDNLVVGSISFSDTTPASYSIDASTMQASGAALEIQAMATGGAAAVTVHSAALLYSS